MIKIRNNKKKTGFQNSNAINVNAKYVDEVAQINNVKKSLKKIELEEDFVMPERTDIDKNVFTNTTGTKEWKNYVKSEEKNVNMVNDYATVTAAEKEFKKDYKYLAHENFKYEKRLDQEIQRHNPIKLLSDNFKQLVNAFGVSASMLSQLDIVKSIAKIIAPPPTVEEIQQIKSRLIRLDPSLITDYYVISQIVQSEELQNYVKNMYEQFEKVQSSPESKFIINLVKHMMDYIILNQNKFGMPQYLQSIYNKYFGSNLNINPNAPVFEPTNQSLTFGHDQTLAPSERITAPPTASPTPATAGFVRPAAETGTPTQPTAGVIRPPLAYPAPFYDPELSRVVESYYNLAFTDIENLKYFYNSLITTEGTNTNRAVELEEVKKYMIAYNMTNRIENINNATLAQLITPLLNALNSLLTLSPDIKNSLINKGNNIISANAFFFQQRQTLTPTSSTSSDPSGTRTPAPARHHQLGSSTPMEINSDLRHIMDRFNEAFTSNITTLKLLYFNILDKKDPILNKFIVLYDTLFRLDNLYDFDQDLAPGKIWIINLFNSLNNLNYPVLNDFKQMIRAKADLAMVSPNYEVSTADNSIQPVEGFTPINYVRPYRPEPSTIAQPYDVKPTTRVNAPSAPTYVSQPTTGPQIAPSPQAMTRGSNIITQKPSNIKVKITKRQATKIIELIINNSTNTTDLINGISQTEEIINSLKSEFNIERGLEIGSMVIAGLSLLAAFKKYYSGKKGSREENLRLLSNEDITSDPSLAGDAIPIIALDGKSLGVKPTTVGRLIQIGKNLNPITIAQAMFDYARNLMRAGSEEAVRDVVEKTATELREVKIEPTSGPSESEARRRIKEAMTKVKESKKKGAEGSGLTQQEKDNIDLEKENAKLKEEVAQFKRAEATKVSKKVISKTIENALSIGVINEIKKLISNYQSEIKPFININFDSFEKYKLFYNIVQNLSVNIKGILTDFNMDNIPFSPFTPLAGPDSSTYNTIIKQFDKKKFDTVITKLKGWIDYIKSLKESERNSINDLYELILNMLSILEKNQKK